MTRRGVRGDRGGWAAKAKDPAGTGPTPSWSTSRCRRCWRYLRANGFRTYIVTGGGQDFVRAYAEGVYGVPPDAGDRLRCETKYDTTPRAKPS